MKTRNAASLFMSYQRIMNNADVTGHKMYTNASSLNRVNSFRHDILRITFTE